MEHRNRPVTKWSLRNLSGTAPNGDHLFLVTVALGWLAKDLHPASFALVMATGAISIAADVIGMRQIAVLLFWLNIVAFSGLWLLVVWRLVRFSKDLFSELFDDLKGPAFFTAAAGTSVVGSQFIVVMDDFQIGMIFWFAALFLWLCLSYASFGSQTIKQTESGSAKGGSGGWGIMIAAAQSIATPGALLTSNLDPNRPEALAFAVAIWVVGGLLYASAVPFVLYRCGCFRWSPAAVLRGLALLFWATGIWWIPTRAILGLSGHLYRRFPLASPLYWGAVFALSIYGVCTHWLGEVIDLPFLVLLARLFVIVALLAWFFALVSWGRLILQRLAPVAGLARTASNGVISSRPGSAAP